MPLDRNNMFFGLADKLTDEQWDYVDSIFDNTITFVNAKSGTGKTTLAVGCAKILEKELLYIFNPTEEGKMGFRKGSQEDKEEAYLIPLKDALLKINENPEQVIKREWMFPEQIENTWVTAMSHTFARGTNIEDKVVIIDEAQNFTRGDLKKILTRVHDNCTVIVIGHDGQCDLKDPRKSGFVPYIKHFESEDYVGVCKLSINFRGKVSTHADTLSW